MAAASAVGGIREAPAVQQDRQKALQTQFVSLVGYAVLIGLGAVFSSTFRRTLPWTIVPSLVSTAFVMLYAKKASEAEAEPKKYSNLVLNSRRVAWFFLSTKGAALLSSTLLNASLIAPSIATPIAMLATGILKGLALDYFLWKDSPHYAVRAAQFGCAFTSSIAMSCVFNAFSWQGSAALWLTSEIGFHGLCYYLAARE